jgi:hypothetical protein
MSVLGGPGLSERLARQVQERAPFASVIVDQDENMLRSSPDWIIWVLGQQAAPLNGVLRDRLTANDAIYLVHHRDLPDLDRPGVPLAQVHRSISLRAALGEL